MNCDEWRSRLATLQAAELAALTGGKTTMVQYGEKRVQQNEINLPALQAAIREAKAKVARCDGCRTGAMIGIIPVDSNGGGCGGRW